MLCDRNQCGVETCGPSGSWPPSLNTREGPAPSSPFLSRGSEPPPLITRGGSAPFQPLPVQESLIFSPHSSEEALTPSSPFLSRGLWSPLPHSPEEPRPLPTHFLPFIYQAWPLESQSTEKLSTRMDLERSLAASLSPWMMYVNYSGLVLGSCTWSVVR
jgi:hypothetical protein